MSTVPFSNEAVGRLLTQTTPSVTIDYVNSSMDPKTLMVYLSTLNVCALFDIDTLSWNQWEGLMTAYLSTHHLVKSPTLEFHTAILIHTALGSETGSPLHVDFCSQYSDLVDRAIEFLGSWGHYRQASGGFADTNDCPTYVGINLAWLVRNDALIESCRNAVPSAVWFPQQFTGPFYNGKTLEAFREGSTIDPTH